MKFTVEKSNIINEFQSLAAVADKKQTLPILSNILIRCESEGVKMLSTDLEVELETTIQGANIITPGETTIPAKKAADIIRELPEGQVSFELNEESSKLTVKSSSGRYNLATIPGSDFPDFDVIKSDTIHPVSTEKLLELFHKTSFAMANQDWRHYLNGCLFEKTESSLNMVATDAHRLSIYKSSLDSIGNFLPPLSLSLARATCGPGAAFAPAAGVRALPRAELPAPPAAARPTRRTAPGRRRPGRAARARPRS